MQSVVWTRAECFPAAYCCPEVPGVRGDREISASLPKKAAWQSDTGPTSQVRKLESSSPSPGTTRTEHLPSIKIWSMRFICFMVSGFYLFTFLFSHSFTSREVVQKSIFLRRWLTRKMDRWMNGWIHYPNNKWVSKLMNELRIICLFNCWWENIIISLLEPFISSKLISIYLVCLTSMKHW